MARQCASTAAWPALTRAGQYAPASPAYPSHCMPDPTSSFLAAAAQSLERTGPNLLRDALIAAGLEADKEFMFKENQTVDGLGEHGLLPLARTDALGGPLP